MRGTTSTPVAHPSFSWFFFFNDTATTEIYTLSLHNALPISSPAGRTSASSAAATTPPRPSCPTRSEEHTSELQSRQYLVCRLLLEKKLEEPARLRHRGRAPAAPETGGLPDHSYENPAPRRNS